MAYKINEDLYIGNTNKQLKDLLVSGGDTLPIGSIIPYGSSTTPSNWLKCDGSAVSRTTYSELFSVIGTLYGSGDGSTTFNLPNLKGKVTIGQDTTDSDFNTIGKTGGEKTHTLTISEMPKHTHGVPQSHPYNYDATEHYTLVRQSSNKLTEYNVDTSATGGGEAHNNMPPYIVTNYIIKANHTSYVGEESVVQTSYSTSTTDTYSCNYINKARLEEYSTTEKIIGTWIDGKPIYRKVLNGVGLAGNTKKSIAYNIDNLDKIWIENGFAINALRTVTVPMVGYNGNLSEKVDVWIEKQENVVKLYANGGWGNDWTFYIIINYTKTTD